MFKVRLITQKQPCSACVITTNLNMETMDRIQKLRDDIDYELIEINHPKELMDIEGVEVEKLPIITVNGEQITAGTIMPVRRLNEILDDF